eukprot:s887_g18.t1
MAAAAEESSLQHSATQLMAAQVAELEAKLRNAEQRAVQVSEAQNDTALRSRVRDLEHQLSRAEENSTKLKEAASRAAERLQEQAMKDGIQRLADASLSSGWSRMMGAVEGVSGTFRAATSRCMRPNRGYEQTPSI